MLVNCCRSYLLLISGACLAFAQTEPRYLITTIAGRGVLPFPADGTPAANVRMVIPQSITYDSSGNLYVSEMYYNRVLRITPGGSVSTVAGNGDIGFSGDSGPANQAALNAPWGLALDAAGNLYIADSNNYRVRRVSPGGTIVTYAGNGRNAASGNEGPATSAGIGAVSGLTVDAQGNLFLADVTNHVIRRVDTNGAIHAVAGTGQAGFNTATVALNAALNQPFGLTTDPQGNLYVADRLNNRVRKITPTGAISTFAGNGTSGPAGDGGPASTAQLSFPEDVLYDKSLSGGILIADYSNARVRRVALSSGVITTFAGGGASLADGVLPNQTRITGTGAVALDAAGNLVIVARIDRRLVKVPATGQTSTVAGPGNAPPGDGGPAIAAAFLQPFGLGQDPNGNLYVADYTDHRIRKIAPDGTIGTAVGTGVYGNSGDGGPAASAEIGNPRVIAFDRLGNMFFSMTRGQNVRKVTPQGTISSVAGSTSIGFSGDKGPAIGAALAGIMGLAVDTAGNLYIADTANNRVRKVTLDGKIDTIAGTGDVGFSGDNGPGVQARLNSPRGLAVDANGNLYIADTGNNRIRKLSTAGTIVTVAGGGTDMESGLPATSLVLPSPRQIAFDSGGNLFIASAGQLRKLTPDGTMSTIVNESGVSGFAGDGGPALDAKVDLPLGLVIDAQGNVYFVDSNNLRVRKLEPVQIFAQDVRNAASQLAGPVAAGEVVAISGINLGPAEAAAMALDAAGLVSTNLAGTQVLFDGVPAPILSAQAGQVTAVVPFSASGKSSVSLQVVYQGTPTNTVKIPVSPSAPAIYLGQITNADGTVNSAVNPAAVGTTITMTVNGAGQITPVSADGQIASDTSFTPVLPLSVQVGGADAAVLSVGSVPGQVTSVMQVTFAVPDVDRGAAVPVVLKVGDNSSQAGVTIALQ